MFQSRSSRWLKGAAALALVLAMLALWLWGAEVMNAALARRAAVALWVDANGPAAFLAFVAIYAAAIVACAPGSAIMMAAGGFLFGPVFGALGSVTGAALGGSIFVLLIRAHLGGWIERRAPPRLRAAVDGFARDGVLWLLAMRLTPFFPYIVANLAAATARAPLRDFVWTTLVGLAPTAFAVASAGAGLEAVIAARESSAAECAATGFRSCGFEWSHLQALTPHMTAGLAALALAALAPVALRKWRGRVAASA